MKQLFRKFHFGGNHYDRLDGERMLEARVSTADEARVSTADEARVSASSSTHVEHRPSSGFSGWLSSRARHGSQTPSGSNHINIPGLTSQTSTEGNEINGRGASPADSSGATQLEFDFLEEEYQVQLAMALSVSKDESPDPEALEIEAVKKISLGLHPTPSNAHVDAVAYRYWAYDVLDYDDKVLDGFYDVYNVSNRDNFERMPSLFDLQGIVVSESSGYEVVLVNRVTDYDLVKLEQKVRCLAMDATIVLHGPLRRAQKIAEIVAEQMGGPVASDVDLLAVWKTTSWELKSFGQNIVLPLGALQIGLARHRALLFKVLADCVGIPCRLVKGRYYTGVDGAVNILKDDDGREYIVDLTGAPGAIIPIDAPVKTSALDRSVTCIAPLQHLPGGQSSDSSRSLSALSKGTLVQGSIINNSALHLEESAIGSSENLEGQKLCTTDSNVQDQINGGIKTSRASLSNCDLKASMSKTRCDISTASELQCHSSVGLEMTSTFPQSSDISLKVDNLDFTGKCHDGMLEEGQPLNLFVEPRFREFDHQAYEEKIAHTQTPPAWKFLDDKKGVDEQKMNLVPSRNHMGDVGSGWLPLQMPRHKLNVVPDDTNNRLQRHKSVEEPNDIQPPMFCARKIHLATLSETSGTTVQDIIPFETGADAKFVVPSITTPVVASSMFKNKVEYNNAHGFDPIFPNAGRRAAETTVVTPAISNVAFEQSSQILESRKNQSNRDSLKLDEVYNVRSCSTSSSSYGQGQSDCGPVSIDDVCRKGSFPAEWEILWEDLSLGDRIGLGSYGEVYHGDWNGTEVAVKKFLDQDISGDALEEFRREVRIMRRLRHPNVVLFMGAVARAPNLSIVTEFLPRGSLYKLIHRPNNDLDERRRLRMALDVVRGMNYLHSSNPIIVHLDLKSPNLLVDKHWVVKVCDFGLSRLKHNTFLSSMSTAGTSEWMAPEVLRNEPSNEKSDVYSFGVILWELATSEQPWSGLNPMQVVGAVGFQHRRLAIPQDIDPQIAQIIQDCWKNEPSLRPSFSQIMTRLKPLQRLFLAPQAYDHHRDSSVAEA